MQRAFFIKPLGDLPVQIPNFEQCKSCKPLGPAAFCYVEDSRGQTEIHFSFLSGKNTITAPAIPIIVNITDQLKLKSKNAFSPYPIIKRIATKSNAMPFNCFFIGMDPPVNSDFVCFRIPQILPFVNHPPTFCAGNGNVTKSKKIDKTLDKLRHM